MKAITQKALGLALGIVMVCAFTAVPRAHASDMDEATQITINQPMQLPQNVVLPAGTYWLMVPDLMSGGHLVQVFNADWQLQATVMARDVRRTDTPQNAELTFAEQSSNRPIALLSWFYPEHTVGHQLVYTDRDERRVEEMNHITVFGQPAPQVNSR